MFRSTINNLDPNKYICLINLFKVIYFHCELASFQQHECKFEYHDTQTCTMIEAMHRKGDFIVRIYKSSGLSNTMWIQFPCCSPIDGNLCEHCLFFVGGRLFQSADLTALILLRLHTR